MAVNIKINLIKWKYQQKNPMSRFSIFIYISFYNQDMILIFAYIFQIRKIDLMMSLLTN